MRLANDVPELYRGDLVKALAAGGRYKEAIAVATSVTDPMLHDNAFIAIAESQAQNGRADKAVGLVANVRSISTRDYFLRAAAQLSAERSVPADAEMAAEAIQDELMRTQAQAHVAIAYASSGDVVRAVLVATERAAAWDRQKTLLDIVRSLICRKQLADAIRATREIDRPYYRTRALAAVAEAAWSAGQAEAAIQHATEARATALGPGGDQEQVSSLCVAAIAQHTVGLTKEALDGLATAERLAAKILSGDLRSASLDDVAAAYASIKDYASATRIMTEAQFSRADYNTQALVRIAKSIAGSGNVQLARRLFREASAAADPQNESLLRTIALEQSGIGDIDGAILSAKRCTYDFLKDKILITSVCRLHEMRQLDAALQAASQITSEIERSYALLRVARVPIGSSKGSEATRQALARARVSAAKIRRPTFRSRSFTEIADLEIQIGELDAAKSSIATALFTANEEFDYAFAGPQGHARNLALVSRTQELAGLKAEADATWQHALQVLKQIAPAAAGARTMVEMANIADGVLPDGPASITWRGACTPGAFGIQ